MTIPGKKAMETRTVGEWLAWAETRLVNADGYVERLRQEARGAITLAKEYTCPECTPRISVPVRHGRYAWEAAWVEHELTCLYQ